MRILVVSNLYPDARLPVFGIFVAAHVEALLRAGATVDLVTIKGIPAHEAVLRKYVALLGRSFLVAVLARLAGRRPQVVEAHVAYPTAIPAWVASRILGARLVVYSHGSDVTRAGTGLHRWLARRVFRAADLHVATSTFIAGELAARFDVDPRKTVVLSPGIDVQLFAGDGSAESLGGRRGVLFVGHLSRGKGVHELLQAVARLERGTELRFVGDGPERAALEAEAGSLGVTARFDGSLPRSAVAEAMRRAAVVAVPSTHPEGLGLVALEGMAAGALVVASRIGGIPETVVDGQNGWLVPPGDVDALAAALRDALTVAVSEDATRRDQLVERARTTARGQDVDAMARRTLAAFDAMVGA